MTIRHQHEEFVKTTRERAFAAIDDLSLTADWLPPCVSLTNVNEGPNAVGDKLRYVFKQGGKQSEMDGEIIAREPGKRLYCKYFDKMFEVHVDLRVSAQASGALTTHIVEIIPKTFFGKMLSPVIRLGLKKQTREAASNLKKLLEANEKT